MTDPNTIIFHTSCWIIQVRAPSGEVPALPARQAWWACTFLGKLLKLENSWKCRPGIQQRSKVEAKDPGKVLCGDCLWSSAPECNTAALRGISTSQTAWHCFIYHITLSYQNHSLKIGQKLPVLVWRKMGVWCNYISTPDTVAAINDNGSADTLAALRYYIRINFHTGRRSRSNPTAVRQVWPLISVWGVCYVSTFESVWILNINALWKLRIQVLL